MTPSTVATWVVHPSKKYIEVCRDRIRLVRLLGSQRTLTTWLLSVQFVTALWPTCNAVAIGWLTTRLGEVISGDAPLDTILIPLVAMAGSVFVEDLALATSDPIQRVTAHRIDGGIRGRLRELVVAPRGIAHLEDPDYANILSRASDIGAGTQRSPGRASVGQVLLSFRVVSAGIAAVLVASFSIALAVLLLGSSLLLRSIIRRQWMYLASVASSQESGARRVRYWSDIAAGRQAAKELRLFGLGSWVVQRRTREALAWSADIWQLGRSIIGRQWWAIGISLGTAAAAMLFPALAVVRGELTTGQMMTCLVGAWAIFRISYMGMEAYDIEYGLDSVRALDQLERRSAGTDGQNTGRTVVATGPVDIRFDGVTFCYPRTDRPVLDGLDLLINAGEILAIVGDSGAGKTTLIKLLAGLYEPSSGQITVGGVDLAELNIDSWRHRLGIVFQDFNKYPLSIADNVALGATDYKDDLLAVAQAMHRVGGDALIEKLPNGLDTILSSEFEGGSDLSGGQWQQIALARALFAEEHGRDLVVLDEPTAHLDVGAEADFYRWLKTELRGRSVVLISHRMSTIRHADRIVLLRDGRVAECGNHQDLMAAGSEYARLFELQATRFTAETSAVPS